MESSINVCRICGKKVHCKGLCDMHYQRNRKYGDPFFTKPRGKRQPKEQRPLAFQWNDLNPKLKRLYKDIVDANSNESSVSKAFACDARALKTLEWIHNMLNQEEIWDV